MDNELLSVSEFAKRAGVSTQSVYGRLKTENGALQEYVVEQDGKRYIKTEALQELYNVDRNADRNVDNVDRETVKPCSMPVNADTDEKAGENREYIDYLLSQIAELKAENRELLQRCAILEQEKEHGLTMANEQLASLTDKVAKIAQQALLATHQQQALTAAEKMQQEAEILPEPEHKSFWKRLRGK